MPRYKITIEYDGTGYCGWQRQADRASVQEALEYAIFRMTGEKAGLCVAGRTDAGVHALNQVAHFDLSHTIPTYNIMHGINFHLTNENRNYPGIGIAYRLPPPGTKGARGGNLSSSRSTNTFPPLNPPPPAVGETINGHPDQQTWGVTDNLSAPSLTLPRKQGREYIDNFSVVPSPGHKGRYQKGHTQTIAVINAEIVGDDFNARFSAKSRTYLYRILNRPMKSVLDHNRVWHVRQPLDVSLMNQAAEYLLGEHDFTSFRDSHCQAKSPIRTLDVLDVKQQGQEIHITTQARAFLHSQVRIMVGTLKCVGEGKLNPQEIKTILAALSRAAAPLTAPAHGLYLAGVEYGA